MSKAFQYIGSFGKPGITSGVLQLSECVSKRESQNVHMQMINGVERGNMKPEPNNKDL